MAMAFEVILIGIMTGMIGFGKMITVFIDRMEVRKLNERTNSIFWEIANKYGIEGKVLEPFSIGAVLKGSAIWGMMVGVPVAWGIYSIMAVLIAMVRRRPGAPADCQPILYKTLEIMGGGSRVIGVACLCVIAAGVAWAVLWNEVEKEIHMELGEAFYNLHRAQERKWMSECDEIDSLDD